VKIGGDLRGGAGTLSGGLRTGRNLGFVSIGGSMLGGAGTDSGSILSGKIAGVKIGGSLVGGDGGVASGRIGSNIAVGPITIGGDFIGRGNGAGLIGSDGILGAIFIGGSVLSFGGGPTEIVASNGAGLGNDTRMSIKSLTIVGSASGLNVVASGADDIIGPIKVGGDWREGSIRASINPGGGGFFGDNNDTANGVGDPLLFSKIASITIGGAVIGTASVGGDGFGFVAQEIGALSIGGTKIPLLPGHGNDTDATLSRYIISASRDFTVHEVA
jgi:hypothetical protein